jgi:Glycosyl transferase family 90
MFLEEIRNTSEGLKWKDRSPYAFWKGNPWVAKTRQDLMRCKPSNGHDWNARLFAQVPTHLFITFLICADPCTKKITEVYVHDSVNSI